MTMQNAKSKVKKEADKIEHLKKQVEEYKNKYLRALADYHNFEKRVHQQNEEQVRNATKRIIVNLLPFLDDLEKAEIFLKDEGLKIIKSQFYQALAKEGLREIDLLNKEFDPHLAEAVGVVEGEKDNIVSEIVKKGYILGDKVIRVAQVKVTKKI
jgi:molecular chaperone GrpE